MTARTVLALIVLSYLIAPAAARAEGATVFVAFPFFHYEKDDEKTRLGFLDLGLAKVFGEETDEEKTEIEIFKVLFLDVFSCEFAEEETGFELLDLGLVEVFEAKFGEGEDRHTKFLDLLLTTVFEEKLVGESFERKFLTFPFIGSLFAQKRDGDKKQFQVCFFLHFGEK